MSANLLTGRHIATVAYLVKHYAQGRDWAKKDDLEIRRELMQQNARSVAYRYSPEGQEEYRRLFADFNAHLEKTWGKENILSNGFSPETAPVDVAECIGLDPNGGLDVWFDKCASAAPLVGCSPAEAYQYLSCYDYQSCEHKDWEQTEAYTWIKWTKDLIASRMADVLLAGRFVWAIRD